MQQSPARPFLSPPLLLLPALLVLAASCGSGDGAAPTGALVVDVSSDVVWAEEPTGLRVLAPEGVDEDAVVFRWSFGDGEVAEGREVEHAWPFAGAFELRVEAFEDEVRVAEGTRTIEVVEPADLALGRPTASPLNLDSDLSLTVDVTVRNRGAETRLPVDLVLYAVPGAMVGALDPQRPETLDAAIADGDVRPLATLELEPLEASAAERAVRFEGVRFPSDAPSGTWRVLVRADPDRRIGDRDRSANAQLGEQSITFINRDLSGPSLSVRTVTARPARTSLLGTVTFSAILANTGDEPALFLRWDAVLEGPGDLEIPLRSGEISNLPARGEVDTGDVQVPLDEPISAPGQYTVRVDLSFTRGEARTTTARSTPITVTDDVEAGVDIAALSLAVRPAITFVGGTVEIEAEVANLGSEDIPTSFFCRTQLTQGDVPEPSRDATIDTFTVRTLAAGESRVVTRIAPITSLIEPGVWGAYLVCDPSFRIPDANRDNNLVRATEALTINTEAQIDLVLVRFEVDRLVADDGTEVTYEMEICNDGSNGATPSVVRVYQSVDSQFSRNDTIAAETTLPSLDPGRCRTLQLVADARCDTFQPNYTLFAEVDATDLVPDSNRANNVATIAEPFRIEGSICTCEADPFEPNNSSGQAALLDPDVRRFTGLTMCTSNEDWYRIPLLAGESIRAVITFASTRGNLDLTLFSTDGSTVLDESVTSRDREEVSYAVVPRRGDYFLRVRGRTAADRNLYDLELSVTSPVEGTDLTVFNVRVDPGTVLPGGQVDVRYDLVNLGDTPAEAHVTRLWLSRDSRLDPTEDILLREVPVTRVLDRLAVTNAVTLPPGIEGGAWNVIVEANARGDIEELDLDNNIGVSGPLLVDDACVDPYEPNNSIGAAAPLPLDGASPFRFEGLRSCTGNPDFYEVCVEGGDTFSVRIDFDPADGDLDMRLFGPAGNLLERSEGLGPEEEVGVDFVTADTCYIVEVYTVGPDRNVPYRMTVVAEPAPPELACNRAAEPNGTFGTAAPLQDWLNRDLALCPTGDTDYFRVNLPAGREVAFQLVPVPDEALPSTLRLSLWSSSQSFLATTVNAAEVLRFTPAVSGVHYVRIRSAGAGERAQPYRITVDGLDGIDLVAVDLATQPTSVELGDAIRFTLRFLNGGALDAPAFRIALHLAPVPFVDERAIPLRTLDADPLAAFTERTRIGNVTLPPGALPAGNAWLVAELDPDGDVQDLDPGNNTIAAPLTLREACIPDAAAPNNVFLDAAALDDFLDEPLRLCPGESDWFTVDLGAGETLVLEAELDRSAIDVDLFGYGPDLVETGTVVRDGDSLRLTLTATGGGPHYVELTGFDPSVTTGYRLQRHD